MKGLKYILDIGSSKMCLFAYADYKNNPIIVCSAQESYDGFSDSEFFEPSQLGDIVQRLMIDISEKTKSRISKVYVGVPSEFAVCICKRKIKKYSQSIKLTTRLARELFEGADDFVGVTDGYKLISLSPMQYELDNGFKTLKPENKKTTQVVLDGSYIFVKNEFVSRFNTILHNLGVAEIEYCLTALGQALLLNKITDSVDTIAVVDVGHITTSVAILKGEGLAMLSSFSLGGGHITADIMQLLNKTYDEAEELKKKVVLSIQPKGDEKYEVLRNGNKIVASIQIMNGIVRSRIENFAHIIASILDVDTAFRDIPVYLTGDGVNNFRGYLEIFKSILKRNVYEYKLPFDNSKDKFQTSKLGLCELVSVLK